MKKLFALMISAILLLQLCACGAPPSMDSVGNAMSQDSFSEEMGFDKDFPSEPEMPMPAPETEAVPDASDDSPAANAKLIYRGSLSLETTAFDLAIDSIEKLVRTCGGYVENSSVTNDNYRSAYYIVRVPAESYQKFFDQVGNFAQINNEHHSVENVSEFYYDTEIRLDTQKAKLERLQELLTQAEDMADIITLESAISDTTLTIEQLSGTLRKYDALIGFSTIEINLEEVSVLSHQEKPAVGFGAQLAEAFRTGSSRFVDDLRYFTIDFAENWAGYLFDLVVLALIIWLAVKLFRRRRSRTGGKKVGKEPAIYDAKTEKVKSDSNPEKKS